MRTIFFNIAQMNFYKGIIKGIDEPRYGGDYVLQTGDAHEKYNFEPVEFNGGKHCLGFFETKTTSKITGYRNQLHIEKIDFAFTGADCIDHVDIIWCAKYHDNRTVVVGWYMDAILYRYYRTEHFENGYHQDYNSIALADNCVLLPYELRNIHKWQIPRKKAGKSYGFGQSNVWYGTEDSAQPFISQLMNYINTYDGENWLYKEPVLLY